MLLLFPIKSYSHPALREHAAACVVYDDWSYLPTKLRNKMKKEKRNEKNVANGQKYVEVRDFKEIPIIGLLVPEIKEMRER